MGYRARIVLLSLGVLFGFGSAIAHFSRGHDYSRHGSWDGPCQERHWHPGYWEPGPPPGERP
jgi:hypothetical protein